VSGWRDGDSWLEHVSVFQELVLDELPVDSLKNEKKLPDNYVFIDFAVGTRETQCAKVVKLSLSC